MPFALRPLLSDRGDLVQEVPAASNDTNRSTNRLPAQSAPGHAPRNAPGVAGSTTTDVGTLAVSRAQRWNRQGQYPAKTVGKLFIAKPNGALISCSGAIITAANESTVWTAGHCVHDGKSGSRGWYRGIVFVPDADNARQPHGWWFYKTIKAPQQWVNSGDHDYDFAGISFRRQSDGDTLQAKLGSQGYRFGAGNEFPNVHIFGYPSAGWQRTDFNGRALWYCQGAAFDANDAGFWDHLTMGCDMGYGASGGPWISDLGNDGQGVIVGTSSHRSGVFPENNYIYSSNHGDEAIKVYNDVQND